MGGTEVGTWEDRDRDIGEGDSSRDTGTRAGGHQDLAWDVRHWNQDRDKGQGQEH